MSETTTVQEVKVKANQHESYWTYTILTLIVPLAGFILGIAYMTKDKKLDRKLGEHLLVASILFSIMWGIIAALWITSQQTVAPLGTGY